MAEGFLVDASGAPALLYAGAREEGGLLLVPDDISELEPVHLYVRRSGQVVALPVRRAEVEREPPLPEAPSAVSAEARTRPFSVDDFAAPAEIPRP